MTREFRNRLGVGLFIVIVATTAIAILPKSTTNAQQVAQPPDRKALRSKIVILRGELALLELEFEADQESLKPKLLHEPELSQTNDLCRQGMKETSLDHKVFDAEIHQGNRRECSNDER